MVRSRVKHSVRAVSSPDRKPWGQGPAALLKNRRNTLASNIAKILEARLDADRISSTGELFPRWSFRKASMRELFSFSTAFTGRTFTRALCKLVVRKLVMSLGKDSIPRDPEVSFAKFLNKQAAKFKNLIAKAKKVKAGIPNYTSNVYVGKFMLYMLPNMFLSGRKNSISHVRFWLNRAHNSYP